MKVLSGRRKESLLSGLSVMLTSIQCDYLSKPCNYSVFSLISVLSHSKMSQRSFQEKLTKINQMFELRLNKLIDQPILMNYYSQTRKNNVYINQSRERKE